MDLQLAWSKNHPLKTIDLSKSAHQEEPLTRCHHVPTSNQMLPRHKTNLHQTTLQIDINALFDYLVTKYNLFQTNQYIYI